MNDNIKEIKENIIYELISGKYAPGQKIPTMREQAKIYGINPNTVQQIYKYLKSEKIIYTETGKGSYLTADKTILNEARKVAVNKCMRKLFNVLMELGYSQEEIYDLLKKL